MVVSPYASYDPSAVAGMLGAVLAVYFILFLVLIFAYICMWKIFKKMEFKGWYALCPVVNSYWFSKGIWGDGLVFLLMWIPFYGLYVSIKSYWALAKAFGRSGWFALGLIFLSPIFYGILAFGSSEYIGPYYHEFD